MEKNTSKYTFLTEFEGADLRRDVESDVTLPDGKQWTGIHKGDGG